MTKKIILPVVLSFALLPLLSLDAAAQRRGRRTNVGVNVGPNGVTVGVGVRRPGGRNVGIVAGPNGVGVRVGHGVRGGRGIRVGHGVRRGRGFRPARPVGHRHARWIPGHYRTVVEQVWVPGCIERRFVPPVYRTDYNACGQPVQVMVQAGHWVNVRTPGFHRNVSRQVWVPGRWI